MPMSGQMGLRVSEQRFNWKENAQQVSIGLNSVIRPVEVMCGASTLSMSLRESLRPKAKYKSPL